MEIAYQGEPGAYSDEAVTAVFRGSDAVGYPTFRLTFEALSTGAVESAVLPAENSRAGVVQQVSDMLWELPGLRIVREHRPFEYRFYLDFGVNGDAAAAEAALNDLQEASAEIRFFGTYPAA